MGGFKEQNIEEMNEENNQEVLTGSTEEVEMPPQKTQRDESVISKSKRPVADKEPEPETKKPKLTGHSKPKPRYTQPGTNNQSKREN